ncbi:hypothetical protein ABBQ32_002473 [Trebouxia sp. C0010 RCD-2024]
MSSPEREVVNGKPDLSPTGKDDRSPSPRKGPSRPPGQGLVPEVLGVAGATAEVAADLETGTAGGIDPTEGIQAGTMAEMTDTTGAGIVGAVVEGMVELRVPDSLGARATGNVTDAELTTLPRGDGAMHVEQTKPLNGATGIGETGVMATVGVGVMGIVAWVGVEVEVEATEELLHSSLGTGIAQSAPPTILQADKHATSWLVWYWLH